MGVLCLASLPAGDMQQILHFIEKNISRKVKSLIVFCSEVSVNVLAVMGEKSKQDNSERYKAFSDAYKEAFSDMNKDDRKQTMDNEWLTTWKYASDHSLFL